MVTTESRDSKRPRPLSHWLPPPRLLSARLPLFSSWSGVTAKGVRVIGLVVAEAVRFNHTDAAVAAAASFLGMDGSASRKIDTDDVNEGRIGDDDGLLTVTLDSTGGNRVDSETSA